jgi:hypothetical protein
MLVVASSAFAGTTVLGTISLGAGTTPTGITTNTTNHIAYVAESGTNQVAAISGYTVSSAGSATALASGALPNLSFPDNVTADSEGFLYAANYCANLTNAASHGLCPSGTPSTRVLSQSIAGTYEKDVVKVPSSASGGTFTVSFLMNGVTYTTTSIAWNASSTAVASAFNNASNGNTTFPSSGVTASGTVNGSSGTTVTFQNGAYGPITNQAVQNSVTGGTPTFTRSTNGTYNSSNGSIALGTCNAASGVDIAPGAFGGDSFLYVGCAGTKNTERCDLGSQNPPFSACTTFSSTTLSTTGITSPASPVPSGVAEDTTNAFANGVVVADAANSTIQEITTSGNNAPVKLASGCVPANVAVGPDHLSSFTLVAPVFVACPGTGTVESGLISNGSIGTMTATALGSHGTPSSCTGAATPTPFGVAENASTSGGNWTGSLVVTDSANNALDVYSLGGSSSAAPTLTGPTCVATGSAPVGVAMDGNFAFVANEFGNSVTVIDPPTGLTRPAKTVKHPKSHHVGSSSHPLVPLLPVDSAKDRGDVFKVARPHLKTTHRRHHR